MAIIAPEMTQLELCKLLNVTPSWVNKTISELDLPRGGRGKLRIFSRAEYYTFQNIKVLLICDISWSFIKELYKQEQQLIREFKKFIKGLKQDNKDGKCELGKGNFIVNLILNVGIESDIVGFKYKNDKHGYELWGSFVSSMESDLKNQVAPWFHKEEINSEFAKVEELLKNFKNTEYYNRIQV